MFIIDRYLLGTYLKTLAVLFLSMTGLFIMVDTTSNFDEFVAYGKQQGGLHRVLFDYYAPRVLTFFDRTSGILAMVAGMFVVSVLYRSNELTAILAGGVPKSRVVRPILAVSLIVSLIAVANREWAIPKLRGKLIYNAQNWKGESPRPMTPAYDNRTDIFLDGKAVLAAQRSILEPKFTLPPALAAFGSRLVAARAIQVAATAEHPAGYLLEEVAGGDRNTGDSDGVIEGQLAVLSPRVHAWLKPNQLFVASEIEFEQLAAGHAWQDMAGSLDLWRAMKQASQDFSAATRVRLHARLVQPLVDMTLVVIGLSLVLRRAQQHLRRGGHFAAGDRQLFPGDARRARTRRHLPIAARSGGLAAAAVVHARGGRRVAGYLGVTARAGRIPSERAEHEDQSKATVAVERVERGRVGSVYRIGSGRRWSGRRWS